MDVILIAFPKSKDIRKGKESIPIALLYLNSHLIKNGINSKFIDFSAVFSTNQNIEIIDFIVNSLQKEFLSPPKLLGINCFSSYQFQWVMKVAQMIKKMYPEVAICIGGSHPTFFTQEILENCNYIDYIAVGEGEDQLLSLSQNLIDGNKENISNIQAIGYRDKLGNVVINSRINYKSNLNIEPKELWHDLEFENYYSDHSSWNNPKNMNIRLAVPIVSSRSCPFKCNFCSAATIMGANLRYRNPENVLDEIEYLNKELGQNYFEFVDDNINVNRKNATQIFSGIINRGLDIQISLSSGIHIASANENLIELMIEAGLVMIKLPIEHGNEYIRNEVIKKRLKQEDIFKIVKLLKKSDVFIFGLFIMGFPEDTSKTLDDSYNLMKELELDVYETASLIPFPGTKLFNQCVRDNLLLNGFSQNDLWKGMINFDASEHDKIYIKPYNMTLDELKYYRKKFEAIRFYSNRAKGIS